MQKRNKRKLLMDKKYKVAGHVFEVSLETAVEKEHEPLMTAYRPFEVDAGEALFSLRVQLSDEIEIPSTFVEETRQDEEGQVIISGSLDSGDKAIVYQWGEERAVLVSTPRYHEATLKTRKPRLQHAIDNSLMLLFAFSTAHLSTLLFHSSTVAWQGKAYMFLGVSGTGKSTHSRLWLKNIAGSKLLNDDNPVVRVGRNGVPVVYGSPWSGKTPCYKNEQYPVGAIVKLHQYPENRIRKASVIEAYVAITESISGKRWEKKIADGLHASVAAVLEGSKVFLLDCLPDDEAAKVCWRSVTGG